MGKKLEISVLLCATGSCPFIGETLDSLKTSTIVPLEILIVDDGLTESAIATIESYQQFLPLKINRNLGVGLVDALNTGLKIAKGDLIARLDADDLILPNRFEIQSSEFEKDINLVAAGSQVIYIDQNGLETGLSNYPVGILNNLKIFKHACLIAHPSSMYRLTAARAIGGYHDVFKVNSKDSAEDFDFWLRVQKVGIIRNLDIPLTKYRQHNQQISISNSIGQELATLYIAMLHESGHQDSQNYKVRISKQSAEFSVSQKTLINEYLGCLDRLLFSSLLWQLKSDSSFLGGFQRVCTKLFRFLVRLKKLQTIKR